MENKEIILSDTRSIQIESYRPEFGEINLPEGFMELLKNKTLEEQMYFYRITEYWSIQRTAYGELSASDLLTKTIRLCDYSGLEQLVVNDGLIVGVIIKSWCGSEALLPDGKVCTYYACDNNGSGYKTRTDYAYLICIPSEVTDHEKNR